jgi:hypothetical protein
MKIQLLFGISIIAFLSCKTNNNSFDDKSNIVSLTCKAQIEYFDSIISENSHLSEMGRYINERDSTANVQISLFKEKLQKGNKIPLEEQVKFMVRYESDFANATHINFEKFKEIEKTPIVTLSDLELLKLYLKSCFVAKLNYTSALPFDTWSTMASSSKWEIKNGEEFSVALNTTATNSLRKAKWYLLKNDTLTFDKFNILDTLMPDEFGEVIYKTQKYHSGENDLMFFVLLQTKRGEDTLCRRITFKVR